MYEGILQACYLDGGGRLLPRFNGIVYDWMYVHSRGMPTDAASSAVLKMHNGRWCRWRPKSMVGNIVAAEESFVPCPTEYRVDEFRTKRPVLAA